MLKTLVLSRFEAMFYRKPKEGKKNGQKKEKMNGKSSNAKIGLIVFAAVYIIIVFGGLFVGNYITFFDNFCKKGGYADGYFSIAAFISVLAGFVGSVMMTQSQIYDAKDNELLLSMPIKPMTILASRIIVLYLTTFFFSAINYVPAMVVYLVSDFSAGKFMMMLLELFMLPLLSMAISFIIAWFLKLITSRMKNKALFNTVGTLIFFGFYMVFCTRMSQIVMNVSMKAEEVMLAFKSNLLLFYICGKAVAAPDFTGILLTVLIMLVPFAVAFYILSKTFIKIATTKTGIVKTQYKGEGMEVRSVRKAIAFKEVKHFISSTTYAVNGGLGLLMMLGLAVYLIFKADYIFETISEMAGGMISEQFMIAMFVILVSSIGTITEVTICSISLEGKNLWILKSSPIKAIDVLKGKLYSQLYIAFPFTIATGIALNFLGDMNIFERVIALLLPSIVQVFIAYFGLAINLMLPKLDWNNEAQAIKQSGAAFVGVFGAMGFITILVLMFLFCYSFLGTDLMLVVFTLAFVLGSVLLEWYLRTKGVKRYENL